MTGAIWKTALIAIAVLGVTTAGGLLIRGNVGSARTKEAAPADEHPAEVAEIPNAKAIVMPSVLPEPSEIAQPSDALPLSETTKTSDSPKPTEPAKASDPPEPSEPAAASNPAKTSETAKTGTVPKASDHPDAANERRQLLETVGTLTAAHCYQTYFNISLLADAKAKGAYTDKDASRVLESVLALLNSVDRKLEALTPMELDKEDRESLEQMQRLSALLRQQGRELRSFWASGKEEDAARYENVRKDSWAAISNLMGLGR